MTATATIRPASAAAAITGAVAWITIALAVGLSGVLATARTPGPQLLMLALTVTTLWMTSRGGLRTLIDAIPIRALVAFHALRLGGVAFLAVSATGTLSPLFATNAGWGDIAAGAGAIALAASLAPDTLMRQRLYETADGDCFGAF